jgi:hypothetical protein
MKRGNSPPPKAPQDQRLLGLLKAKAMLLVGGADDLNQLIASESVSSALALGAKQQECGNG